MGENQALVWILLAFLGIMAVGIIFAGNFNINADTFFRGIS